MECWAIITDFQQMQISLSCFISSLGPVTWNLIFCSSTQNFLHTNSLLLILFFSVMRTHVYSQIDGTIKCLGLWLVHALFQFKPNTLFTIVIKNPSNVQWVCIRSRDHGEELSLWANFESAQKLNRKCYNLWLSPCTPFRLDTSCCISAFHLWNLILSLSHLKP